MSGYTKTPWELSRDGSAYLEGTLIIDPINGVEIAGVWKEGDAQHIVNCVNNHERLVEALRGLLLDYKPNDGSDARFEQHCRTLLAELENQQ